MTRIDDSKFLRGSPESRAIARALVAKTEPSPAGKALLAFLDRRTEASKEFFLAHGREPVEGDVLRLSDLEATCGLDLLDFPIYVHCPPVAEGEEATRDDGCRVKVKGGRIYRTKTAQEQKIRDYGSRACWDDVPGSDWMVFAVGHPARWSRVEGEALGIECIRPDLAQPSIPAVTFVGAIDGKHRCRPATEAEVSAASTPETPPSFNFDAQLSAAISTVSRRSR